MSWTVVFSHLCVGEKYKFIGRVWEPLKFYSLEALGQFMGKLLVVMITEICKVIYSDKVTCRY